MKREKRGYFLIVLLCGMVSLTACTSTVGTDEETPYYSIMIDGSKEYKPEENESVQQLKELAQSYVSFAATKDYQSQENAFEELNYYNESFRSMYEEYNYIQDNVEIVEYYEQVQEVVEANVVDIQFYVLEDIESARVACEYISVVKHATDEYLEEVGVKLDTKYKRVMTINFVKENDEWKISQYDITDREEVA